MLALDNAPGGIKDLSEETDIPLVISRFCHAPTFSTLDIGGGTQSITATDLTSVYSAASPPEFPKNVPMNNFMTSPTIGATSNQIHTQLTLENANWLLSEIKDEPELYACFYSCALIDPISGPSLVCSSSSVTYSLGVVPVGNTVTWQATPSYLFSVSSGTSATATLQAANSTINGSAIITFTINEACGQTTVSKSIWVGKPYIDGTYNNGQLLGFRPVGSDDPLYYNPVCNGDYVGVNLMPNGSSSGTLQKIASNPYISVSISGNNAYFYFWQVNQTLQLRYTTSNGCGTSANDYFFKSILCQGGGDPCEQYTVSPNPSNFMINIVVPNVLPPCESISSMSITDSNDLNQDSKSKVSIQSVNLFDTSGQLMLSEKFSEGTLNANLDISGLKKGTYILKISNESYIETHRIIVK